MDKIKLVIPTNGNKGLEDTVSDVFGRAEFFTIIEISRDSICEVDVLKNPAVSYKHGAGPIVVKTLVDMDVKIVAAGEFGVGASTLLDQNRIRRLNVKSGISVREAVKTILKELTRQN